ncbi:hypothetical protein TruAng_001351 [Truncatella angustata]|nr:hypothetical protein TruAng_001351 [Truncatella angustata]
MQLYKEQLASHEIRILTIQPNIFSSPIQCSLATVTLDKKPCYGALSYVWGSPETTGEIVVDLVQVAVTANLASALRHLRHTVDSIVLWIDAICINQGDNKERSAQVKMMGRIYSNAATVFLWIGEADENSDVAFESMPAIAAGGEGHNKATDATFGFYSSLDGRPWFSRVWILQEMALATEDPIVACGGKRASWSLFISAWTVLATRLFSEIGMVRPKPSDSGRGEEREQVVEVLAKLKIDVLNDMRNAVRKGTGESLRQLLLTSRSSESTDPRDKIYALLGMLRSEDRDSYFVIDYQKPVATVYAEAVAHLFAKGDGPSFLSSMWLSGLEPKIPGLPSWALDFSAQSAEVAIDISCIDFNPPSPQSVSGPGAGAINGVAQDDVRTLKVEALPVDLVDEVICLDKDFARCLTQLTDINQLAAKARTRCSADEGLDQVIGELAGSEPLWRILISNKAWHSGYDVAPDEYAAMYDELLTHCFQAYGQDPEPETVQTPTNEYLRCLRDKLPGRAFFTTTKGFIGLSTPVIRPGDEITIWFGATIPFVVRPIPRTQEFYQLVSGAYVGGIMNGKMVDQVYCEDLLDSKTLFIK